MTRGFFDAAPIFAMARCERCSRPAPTHLMTHVLGHGVICLVCVETIREDTQTNGAIHE